MFFLKTQLPCFRSVVSLTCGTRAYWFLCHVSDHSIVLCVSFLLYMCPRGVILSRFRVYVPRLCDPLVSWVCLRVVCLRHLCVLKHPCVRFCLRLEALLSGFVAVVGVSTLRHTISLSSSPFSASLACLRVKISLLRFWLLLWVCLRAGRHSSVSFLWWVCVGAVSSLSPWRRHQYFAVSLCMCVCMCVCVCVCVCVCWCVGVCVCACVL